MGEQAPMAESFDAQVDAVVERGGTLWTALHDKPLLVTGGTGFIGRWLLESLLRAQTRFGLDLDVLVVTRNAQAFRAKLPHLAQARAIRLFESDIQNFSLDHGHFPFVIHGAATSAKATFDGEDPLAKFDMAFEGTRRLLDTALRVGAERVLVLGSGSVYGGLSQQVGAVDEQFEGAPLTTDVAAGLGHGKRAAEFLCAYYAERRALSISVARCFSFVGAFLPFNIHYAIGNFIRDALVRDAIVIQGDGSPLRSYMFAGDLVIWLLTLLLKGEKGQLYNVGSDRMISLTDLAFLVRDLIAPGKPVQILGRPGSAPRSCYVPNIGRTRRDFGLDVWTSLEDSILLTATAAGDNRWASW